MPSDLPCDDLPQSPFLDAARSLLGAGQVLTDDLDAYTVDWRRRFSGRALAVLRPGSTAEVAATVALCAAHGVSVVPQGGNTGMCGAATPDASGAQVVLCLSRLNRIRAVDSANNTMTVDAGCVLKTLQDAAAEADRLFPLSLGAEGSCQIGGNIATNAGGVQVLRYGNTRDLVLGLEVVLADGQVLDLLRALRKDNTGYDLKQLFIGSEGTLGIVTAATLKLFAAPKAGAVAFAAVESPARALDLLRSMRDDMGERFSAFELLSLETVRLVQHWFPASPRPFDADHPWYVLMEARDGGTDEALAALFQATLERALERGTIDDVAVATSKAQAEALWKLRDSVSEAQQHDGATIKHDISVPVSSVPAFVSEALALLRVAHPGIRPFIFGHLGDGNLHFNISRPAGWDNAAWEAETDAVNLIVHDTVARHAGSISAEHGIGQLKRHEVGLYKSALEIDVMQRVKRALDPRGLMNPGKLLPD